MPNSGPQKVDTDTNPRIKALSFSNCSNPNRTANQWYPAREPMHCNDGVNDVGPSFAFGRTLADSLPLTDTIGLIPCGLWGVGIEMFAKGDRYNGVAGQNKPSNIYGLDNSATNAYQWMLNKCMFAKERGVISGIIMHQGEANTGNGTAWASKVKKTVKDLKTDLGLGDIPFVAGELREDTKASFNSYVNKFRDSIPNCHIASSRGLGVYNDDGYGLHFNQDGYRELGKRLAIEMLKGLRIPTAIKQQPPVNQPLTVNELHSNAVISLYTIDGRKVAGNSLSAITAEKKIRLFVMQKTGMPASLVINPN